MSRSPSSRSAQAAAAATAAKAGQDPELYRAATRRRGLTRLVAGGAFNILVLILGLLAKSGPVADLSLRMDRHIAAQYRTGALTALARAASTIATPETVGVALLIAVPVILVLMGRRLDALKAFCILAGAFALAEAAKKLVGEHRPPAALRAMAADSGASYPSGHVTIAAALTVALVVVAVTVAGRSTALVLGGLFAVAVAVSRVYLADHYPLDVIGSVLCALAGGFIVTGLAALPGLAPYLRRLDAAHGRPR
jgi:membrane-associated phospholipid phosphatase